MLVVQVKVGATWRSVGSAETLVEATADVDAAHQNDGHTYRVRTTAGEVVYQTS